MGRPFTWQVEDRRESVQFFLDQGLSPQEIADKLGQRLSTIQADIEFFKKEVREKREFQKALKEAEERAMSDQLHQLEETLEKLKKPKAPVSRGPKKPMSLVQRRRGLVNVFRVLGRTQKRIAELLETPLRTIQRDCSRLDAQPVTRGYVKELEKMIKRKLGWLEDAEILEVLSDGCSEERKEEILALNDERRKKGLEVWEPKKASPPPSALG